MRCPHCDAADTVERRERTELGYRRFRCWRCHREFNERTGTRFNHLHYRTRVVCGGAVAGSVIHVMLRCMRCPEKYLSYSSLTKLRLSISITCIPPPVDENLNFTVDPGEQKRYFEVSVATNTIFSRMTTNRQLPALHAYPRHCSRTRCSHLLFPRWQARLGDPSTSLRCALRGPEVNCSPAGSLFSPVRARRNPISVRHEAQR